MGFGPLSFLSLITFLPYCWLYQARSWAELNVNGTSISSSSGHGPVHQESIDKSLSDVF